MADVIDTLSTPTVNYSWLKPDIGGDNDNWGNELNADLDAIDAKVHAIETNFSASLPSMDSVANPGSAATFAHSDHVHPTDTSRYAASNPSNFIDAAHAPVQSVAGKTGAVVLSSGDITTALGYTPYSNANPSGYITAAAVPTNSGALPVADGTALAGTPNTYAREGHVHPTDTSRAAASALSSYLPLTGGTLTGALTPSQTAGIVGTTAANNANPGAVGEYKKIEVTTNVPCPNSGQVNVATLSLPAGDWDVFGIGFGAFTGTPQEIFFAVTLTSATIPTGTLEGCGGMDGAIYNPVIPTGPLRVSIAATTNVYLVGTGTWTGTGSCNLQGFIRARRVR